MISRSRWKCIVAFGSPVVPDVKPSSATSSRPVRTASYVHRLVERGPVELGVVVGGAVEPDHLREVPALLGAGDELVHQPRVAQRDGDLGLVDDLRQLAGPQHRHRVHDHRAGLRRRQPARDHRRVVGRPDEHAVAGLHAVVLGERVRQAVGPVGELLVGAPPPVADQRGVVAEALLDQTIGQLDGGVEVLGVVEAVEQQLGPFVERREIVTRERVDVSGRPELHCGTTAVASISTFARRSTNATTCTSAIAGKCLPMISR